MRTNNTMMKLDEIKNPEFKNYINLAYMQGENNNFDAVSKIEKIQNLLKFHTAMTMNISYPSLQMSENTFWACSISH